METTDERAPGQVAQLAEASGAVVAGRGSGQAVVARGNGEAVAARGNGEVVAALGSGQSVVARGNGEAVAVQGNGQAVASLVFGIFSLLFCWLGLVGVAMVLLAIVFGLLAILRVRLGFATGRDIAISGVALGVAGLGLYLYFGVAALGLGFRV